ncbi:Hypothetical predicted protein [Pelobates cultripes]|uniref:Uncharacterized protein n=1 Tax=Pelobates cultripes TaxID=61616 RepID=A0AAD1RXZ2_PELCU|nr:Hypothetical predicted protein [Pelobates cultripes]
MASSESRKPETFRRARGLRASEKRAQCTLQTTWELCQLSLHGGVKIYGSGQRQQTEFHLEQKVLVNSSL